MIHDGHETPEALFIEAASGDADAFNFLKTIIGIAHTWDDLIDRDKALSDDNINDAFTSALLTIPANPFYVRNRALLEPVLLLSVMNWRAATQEERDAPTEWTFIIRSSYVDLIVMTKLITGGLSAAIAFIGKVRGCAHHEHMDGYLKALRAEGAARE